MFSSCEKTNIMNYTQNSQKQSLIFEHLIIFYYFTYTFIIFFSKLFSENKI
jgi:hypothetical protein